MTRDHLTESANFIRGVGDPARIGWTIEDHRHRSWRHSGGQFFRQHFESALHGACYFNASSTSKFNERAVAHPCWRWQNDFIARINERLQNQVQRVFGTSSNGNMLSLARDAVLAPEFPCDRISRLNGAWSGHVLSQSRAEAFDGGLFDVVGSVEIRLPGSEGDYVSALFLECRCASSDSQGGALFHTVNARGNLHKTNIL